MNIRYVARDLEWTEAMKEAVWSKVVEPLRKTVGHRDFELSVHLQAARRRGQDRSPEFEVWLVLQRFDGRGNELVRCAGPDFYILLGEATTLLRAQLRKAHEARRRMMFFAPFRSPFSERQAVGSI